MRRSRIIFLGFVLLVSSNSFGQWPQFRNDNYNTGNNASENIITTQNVSKLVLNWTFPLSTAPPMDGPLNTSPVVETDVLLTNETYVLVVEVSQRLPVAP
jgi:hypothetical protein